jgi:aminopeptidase-like protein
VTDSSTIAAVAERLDLEQLGLEMHDLARALFPIHRSLTGDGFRQTLDVLARTLPLERFDVPSGTRVFDWTVPQEWNVREAWVKGPDGRTVIDVADQTLHLLGYSASFRGRISRAELLAHLHSLPERPDWIPFRTSYYRKQWGFSVADRVKRELPDGMYDVLIDTTLEDGSLTYAEHEIRGSSEDAVLVSCHACHPSMANDNLSAVVVAHRLARLLAGVRTRRTYWFLFLPGTIGAVTWLARNPARIARIRHGLVLTCLGDRGGLTYKRSRRGDAAIDRIAAHVVAARPVHRVLRFDPFGADERQYCSPGIDLPVGRLSRTPDQMFPEYHTSADDLDFITPQSLGDSLAALVEIVEILEGDRLYRSTSPMGEPQLEHHGIYDRLGRAPNRDELSRAVAWVLNLSDGRHTLFDIAERAAMPFRAISQASGLLESSGLVEPVERG